MSDRHDSNEPDFTPVASRFAELWFESTSPAIRVLVEALTALVRPLVTSISDDERRVSRGRWDDFFVALPGTLDGNGPELVILDIRSGPTDPTRTVYVTTFERELKVEFVHITDVQSLHAVESFHAQVI